MMTQFSIILFGMNDFRTFEQVGFRTRDAEVLMQLRSRPTVKRIVYVNSLPSTKQVFVRKLRRQSTENEERFIIKTPISRLIQVDEKLFVLDYDLNPYALGDLPIVSKMLRQYLDSALLKALSHRDLDGAVLWLFSPLMATFIGRLGERLAVFDAVDNWLLTHLYDKIRKQVRNGYSLMEEKADIVFTVSASLKETIFAGHPCVNWVPNGVDVDFFYNERVQKAPLPDDLKSIKPPRVGFVGVIESGRTDLELIRTLSERNPDVSFVLIGPVWKHSQKEKVLRCPNVFFLGPRPHSEIPIYLRWFDACMCAYVVSQASDAGDSLKLYEYLAAGKPVVSTDIAGAKTFRDVIHIATDANGFHNGLLKALSETHSNLAEKRRQAVRGCSWESRVDSMLQVISDNTG